MVDISYPRTGDILELLRPIAGADSPSGIAPDNENAPRIDGQNILIWLNAARNRALALDEEKAGLPLERPVPAGEGAASPELWENIFRASHGFLMNHGKDIRLVFFCLEGLARRDGMAGFAEGLLLLRGMLAAYWETLHPLPREGAEVDRRQDCLALYFAVDDAQAAGYTPLFLAMNLYVPVAENGDETVYLADCLPDGVARPDVALLPESVRVAARATDPLCGRRWLAQCRRAIRECAAYETLAAGLRFSMGPAPMPTIRKVRRHLEATAAVLAALYEGVNPEAGVEEGIDNLAAAAPVPERLAEQLLTNKRSDNLRLLRALGRCFRNNEPHSPVGYALNHWADLAEKSLPDLLDAIGIVDPGERGSLRIFTGVQAPPRST